MRYYSTNLKIQLFNCFYIGLQFSLIDVLADIRRHWPSIAKHCSRSTWDGVGKSPTKGFQLLRVDAQICASSIYVAAIL